MKMDDSFNHKISGDGILNILNSTTLTIDSIKKELVESSKQEDIEQIIYKILLSSNIYVFSEILIMPEICALKDGHMSSYYKLLELYAYGTYKDYIENKATLPDLNDQQIKKLKFLTVVDLAYRYKSIPYCILKKELNIGTIRELEDLVIEIIYAGLIKGKLCQTAQLLCVEYAMGRDLKDKSIQILLGNFEKWYENNNQLISLIENEICDANKKKKESFDISEKYNENVESLKRLIKSSVISGTSSLPQYQHPSKIPTKYQNLQHESSPSHISNNHYYPISSQKSLNLHDANGFAMEEDDPMELQIPSTSQTSSSLSNLAQSSQKQSSSSSSNTPSTSSSKKQTKPKSGIRGSAAKLFHKQ